jgi:hypothetical protein
MIFAKRLDGILDAVRNLGVIDVVAGHRELAPLQLANDGGTARKRDAETTKIGSIALGTRFVGDGAQRSERDRRERDLQRNRKRSGADARLELHEFNRLCAQQ